MNNYNTKINFNLKRLLFCEFHKDSTPIECTYCETGDFTEGSMYTVNTTGPISKVYNNVCKSVYTSNYSNTDEGCIPRFSVKRSHLAVVAKGPKDQVKKVKNNIIPQEETMKNVINRLNGLSLAEEGLVELRQNVATKSTITLDLANTLKETEGFKSAGFGEQALVESLKIENDRIVMRISKGTVTREDNSTVWKAIEKLVKDKKDSEK